MANDRNIKVKTPLGPEALLFQAMTGHDRLGSPFKYQLSLLSRDPALDLSVLLGQLITVEVTTLDGMPRFFNGHVTSFSMLGAVGDYMQYEVTLRPWLWLLSMNSDCRIFQEMTVPDIVKQICRERGFTDFRESLTGSYRTWEYLVQYRESDFNFVSRLLEQEGIYYFIEHTDGKHTVVFADSPGAHVPAPGYEEVPYYPPEDQGKRARDHLSSFIVARQMRPGKFTTTDYDFKRPKADLMSKLHSPLQHAHAEFEVYDYPGEFVTNAHGETHVRLRLEEHQTDYETAQASGDAAGLAVGALFKLANYPREDQNREYLVVTASYNLTSNAYESGVGDVDAFAGSYVLMDSKRPYRAPSATPKPRVDGPHTATVVGKSGEEIWTDEYGRVKVQFHWDRLGQRDENSSCWVRVAHPWAGTRWGMVQIPRMGQEVIVEFLEGDPDHPIITGSVYNADNMPPYDLPANATQSGIKSRSSKGGSPTNFNEIRFEDKKGQEEVFIQAEKDQNTNVKNNQSITVGANRTVTVKGTQATTVTKKDTVTVQDEREETIQKKVTETYQAEHEMGVTGPQKITVEKDKTEHVMQAYDLKTDKRYNLQQGGTKLTFEANKVNLDAASSISVVRGPAKMTIDDAGKVVISTPTAISFECGPNKITLSPSGIEISALQVAVKAATSSLQVNPAGVQADGATLTLSAKTLCSIMGVPLKLN